MLICRKPAVLERGDDGVLADPVERGVDDGEITSTADRLADHGRNISLVHLTAHRDDQALGQGLLEGKLRDLAVRRRLDAFDDSLVVGRNHLAARAVHNT